MGRRGDVSRVKLDLTHDEILVLDPVMREVYHPYSDRPEMGIHIACYCFEELFAEKIRALAERERPRDLYDVVHLYRHDRELYPGCPSGREFEIAEHACQKYSGRVGRSVAAKSLDADPIRLAVIAHVRHTETNYDKILGRGYDRWDARREVEAGVQDVLEKWLG